MITTDGVNDEYIWECYLMLLKLVPYFGKETSLAMMHDRLKACGESKESGDEA
jgi:hypothetical protein